MKVVVISLFPEMFSALTESGITRRAIESGLVGISFRNPRDFAFDRHHTVDDRPYGGGPGMIMRVEPLALALESAYLDFTAEEKPRVKVIYLSPQGRRLDACGADELGQDEYLILVCGRYEGIDERFIDTYVDEEWSIGDYVLSGGELPAMVLLDAVIRKTPEALGHAQSADQDSFEMGLLDCPHYTRPVDLAGQRVPDVLLSGNHQAIAAWRHEQARLRTAQRRPDLVQKNNVSGERP